MASQTVHGELFVEKEQTAVVPAHVNGAATALEKSSAPSTDLLAVIAQAVADPRIDVEKMERLLVMHEKITAQNRKIAFDAAMARLQPKLPQITKSKKIIVKGNERSRYAPIEDIDAHIRKPLAEEGFSFSFDSDSTDGKLYRITAKLSHCEGHSETKTVLLPLDSSDYRSAVQSAGSTISYGRRTLIKMHLNLIEVGEDNDGTQGKPISQDQADTLRDKLNEINADVAKFLQVMGVPRIEDMDSDQLAKAYDLISKRGAKR